MRAFLILIGWLLGLAAVVAQEKTVQDFSGNNTIITGSFQVGDRWEIRWNAPVSITVYDSGGALAAGASGLAPGSLYQPKGGTFSLKIEGTRPWHVTVVELGSVLATSSAGANYVPPSVPGVTNSTLSFSTKSAALPTLIQAPATFGTQGLTKEQAHAVVVIKGDIGVGTGFLARTKNGPAVITNLHVIDANPNLHILTTTGVEIKPVAFYGASDRDLALFTIKDDHYNYLDLADDVAATVRRGDAVITPGNSEGGGVVLDTRGEVRGIGPDTVEVSNPIYHGNSGGPVFDLATGKVIGVVSFGSAVRPSDELDKASAANANSAISGTMRYFAYRIDTVPAWEPYDMGRFMVQATFLKNFEELSRCLDSLMNGKRYEKLRITSMDPEEGPPNSHYYMKNDKIRGFANTYSQESANAGDAQRLDAQRVLVMDLDGLIDNDNAAIQNASNFYSFEQIRAKHDYEYRAELKKELDGLGNKISDLGH